MVNYLINFNFKNVNPSAKIAAPCPDQYVGDLNNGIFTPFQNRQDINYLVDNGVNYVSNKLISPIAVILESPHKYEFDPITLSALGPAMGETGGNFCRYFDLIISKSTFNNILCSGRHSIVLMNAVQYQCSLGANLSGIGSYKNKKIRDSNFMSCFNTRGYNDLAERIKAISPKLSINLCTIGLKRNNLQLIVDAFLNSYSFANTNGTHPSRWNNPINRRIN